MNAARGIEHDERVEAVLEMRRLHREGWNIYELGARYNWPVKAVMRVVGRRRRRVSDEQPKAEDRASGLSLKGADATAEPAEPGRPSTLLERGAEG